MKTFLFSLSMFGLLSISVHAQDNIKDIINLNMQTTSHIQQNDYWWIPDTITVFNTQANEIEREIYHYNDWGYVVSMLIQKKDNVEWTNISTNIYDYDEKKNLGSITIQSWKNNQWENLNRYVLTYDDRDNLLTYLRTLWAGKEWQNSYLYTYTYDNRNNKLSELKQEWILNRWVEEEKWSYEYTEKDSIAVESFYLMSNNTWKLTVNNIYTYEYDEKNNLTLYIKQDINNYSDKIERTYNMDNFVLSREYYFKESWDTAWIRQQRWEYMYDDDNKLIQADNYGWKSGQWRCWEQYFYIYDNNRISYAEKQIYENAQWNITQKINYSYDDKGNVVLIVEKNKLGSLGWYTYQGTYLYDENGNILLYEWEYLKDNPHIGAFPSKNRHKNTYDEYGNGITAEYWIWNDDDNEWVRAYDKLLLKYNNGQSETKTYTCWKLKLSLTQGTNPNPISEPENDQITSDILIYPNPTEGELRVECGGVRVESEIFDLMGKKMLSQKAEGRKQKELDISYLPAGMYFVRVQTDKGVITRKVVKR